MTSVAVGDLDALSADRRRRARLREHRRTRCRPGNGWSGSRARSASSTARSPRPARRRAPGPRSRSGASTAPRPRRSTIGAAVREAQRRHDDPIAAILAVEPGKLLYQRQGGRRRSGAPPRASCAACARFDGLDDWRGCGHEHRLPERVDRGVARRRAGRHDARPDLRARHRYRARRSAPRRIRYGQRVTVIALPPPPVFLSPKGPASMSARAPSATTSTSGACFRA